MRAWMKKCMALALCAALCLGLAACGENAAPSTASGANAPGFEGEEAPDYNLITGQPLAEGMAVGQRPVAVMVRAERAGWPQSGLAGADALVEMATQGGQTALMALYANAATLPQVGPVGPLWDQHLQLAMAVDAVCVHIGGSVYAENLLNAKTYQDVDGEYVGTQSFVFMTERRDYGNEFSWYVNAEGLSTGMSTVGLDASKGSNVPFLRFAKAPFTPAGGDAPEVAFQFSEQCPVRLVYDEAGSVYLKEAYGEAHKDGETQLAFQNVLVCGVIFPLFQAGEHLRRIGLGRGGRLGCGCGLRSRGSPICATASQQCQRQSQGQKAGKKLLHGFVSSVLRCLPPCGARAAPRGRRAANQLDSFYHYTENLPVCKVRPANFTIVSTRNAGLCQNVPKSFARPGKHKSGCLRQPLFHLIF
jgi:hypothetical protein